MKIAADLARRGANVVTHDPIVTAEAAHAMLGSQVLHVDDAAKAAAGADALIVATSWDAYKRLDWSALSRSMRQPVILDGRQVVKAEGLPSGTKLLTIGRHVGGSVT